MSAYVGSLKNLNNLFFGDGGHGGVLLRLRRPPDCSVFRMQGFGCGLWVSSLGFGVQGLGLRVEDLGFGVEGLVSGSGV